MRISYVFKMHILNSYFKHVLVISKNKNETSFIFWANNKSQYVLQRLALCVTVWYNWHFYSLTLFGFVTSGKTGGMSAKSQDFALSKAWLYHMYDKKRLLTFLLPTHLVYHQYKQTDKKVFICVVHMIDFDCLITSMF